MTQAVNVNFKIDREVKKSMERACADMGLSMSAAFAIFARKVGRERRIPFEISADPFYQGRPKNLVLKGEDIRRKKRAEQVDTGSGMV